MRERPRSRRLRSLWRPEPSKVRCGHTEQKCRAARSTTKSQTGDRVFNFILKARGTDLEAALKAAKPIQFKENIALVLKYFDKLTPLMQQDVNPRPAD
jgi:hypothetical protein